MSQAEIFAALGKSGMDFCGGKIYLKHGI